MKKIIKKYLFPFAILLFGNVIFFSTQAFVYDSEDFEIDYFLRLGDISQINDVYLKGKIYEIKFSVIRKDVYSADVPIFLILNQKYKLSISKVDLKKLQIGEYILIGMMIRFPYWLNVGSHKLYLNNIFVKEIFLTEEKVVSKKNGDTIKVTLDNNLIKNYSFEYGLFNENWRVINYLLYCYFRDNKNSVHGDRSLCIEFFGIDFNFYHIYQNLKVKPETKYCLSYYIKSEDIFSDRGFYIELIDGENGFQYYCKATPFVLGTTEWQKIRYEFITKEGMNLLQLRFRHQGWYNKFNLLFGSVWIDLLTLEEMKN